MPHTHTQRHVCILIAAALQRCCSHKSCRVQRPPAKCKYLRNMPLGRQQAACSRRQAACSIRQTGCVGDIHSSFDLYRLATCNMRRCICARLRPPPLHRPSSGQQPVSTDCNQDWLFACARPSHRCDWAGYVGSRGRGLWRTGAGASAAKAICGMENCFAAFRLCVRHFKVFIFCLRSLWLPRGTQLHPAQPPKPLSRSPPPSQSSTRRFAAVSQFAICELLISTHSLISVSCSRWPANRQNGGTTKRLRVGFRVAAAGDKATRP